jgi:malonyl-CoA O-methyltransferase
MTQGPHAAGVAPDPAAIRRHFGKAAPGYWRASTRFPWAWLRGREAAALLALVGPLEGRRVLDLGSGAGYYTRLVLERGARDAVAVDLSPAMVAQVDHQRTLRVVADAASVSLTRRFDLILTAGVLEFARDPAAVLRNAAGLARPGAVLAALIPLAGAWGRVYRAYHLRHGIAIRLYTRDELAALAAQAGWRMESARPVWPYTLVARLGLARA